ncbi:unnamed protein product [Linum trigynum]|uniref:Uncharacterized protein n=1 Tax=Linum trigynum TaxID=586398 RepID=A0AAV2DWV6_9ROSI
MVDSKKLTSWRNFNSNDVLINNIIIIIIIDSIPHWILFCFLFIGKVIAISQDQNLLVGALVFLVTVFLAADLHILV